MARKRHQILMLHASSDLYGASRVLLQVAIILKDQGHRPLLVISAPGDLQKAFEQEGIQVYIKPLAVLRRKYLTLPGLWNRIFSFKKAIKELSALIKEHHIDIIYTNTAGVWVGAVLARRLALRHIWHIHEIIKKPKLLTTMVSWLARRSRAEVVVVSDAVKTHWLTYLSEASITRIYNGFDFSYLDSNTKRSLPEDIQKANLRIGMIARVHFWKGQAYFLEIAAALKALGIKAKFIMVGDAFSGYEYLYDELKSKKRQLGLEEDVIDLGFRLDVGHILAHLDLFILPSILPDPLPTTVLEAMSKGKAIAATAHGGALEMVEDGVTGIHMPWDDASQAARKIKELIEDAEELNRFGLAGEKRLNEHFSEDAFKKNILALIDRNDQEST